MNRQMEIPTIKPVAIDEYDDSDEEAKHPGAILGWVMGIYPAVLIVAILLVIIGIGIRNAYRFTFPSTHSVQVESTNPADSLKDEVKP
jgi:hypothetical protein